MNILIYIFSIIVVFSLYSCGEKVNSDSVDTKEKVDIDLQNIISAGVYSDSIISKTDQLIAIYEYNLLESFLDYIPSDMEEKYNSLEQYVEYTIVELYATEPFQNDSTLIDAAKNLLHTYENVLPLYKQKVELESTPTMNFTQEMINQSEQLTVEIEEILNTANDKFIVITKEFANTHNFKINE